MTPLEIAVVILALAIAVGVAVFLVRKHEASEDEKQPVQVIVQRPSYYPSYVPFYSAFRPYGFGGYRRHHH